MKKVKNSLMVLIAAIATLGVVTLATKNAQAKPLPGVEDTWDADAGDCVGAPTDCLDTLCCIIVS